MFDFIRSVLAQARTQERWRLIMDPGFRQGRALVFALASVIAAAGAASAHAQSPTPRRPVATFSIVARDPATGQVGVAVQSHWFSVGSMVTWAAPGGQTGYDLLATRFDGSPQRTLPQSASQTTFSENTGGATTCYQLAAKSGTSTIGRTDKLCVAPGSASFPSGAPRSLTTPDLLESLRRPLP